MVEVHEAVSLNVRFQPQVRNPVRTVAGFPLCREQACPSFVSFGEPTACPTHYIHRWDTASGGRDRQGITECLFGSTFTIVQMVISMRSSKCSHRQCIKGKWNERQEID